MIVTENSHHFTDICLLWYKKHTKYTYMHKFTQVFLDLHDILDN